MMDFINKYTTRIYAAHCRWSSFGDSYKIAINTVTGHLSMIPFFVLILIIVTFSELEVIKWSDDFKLARPILVISLGGVGYFLVVKPIEKFLLRSITKTELENTIKQDSKNRNNTLIYMIWTILAIPALLLLFFFFTKLVWIPLIGSL